TYTINMNEAVTGFAPGDVSVSGLAGCSVSTGTSGATVLLVTLSGCPSGSVALSLAAGSISDLAGNTGPAAQYDAASVTVATPSVSVPSSVPVDTGAFVSIASRSSAVSLNNITAATVNVVVTASSGYVKLTTTTGLSAIPGYTAAQWTANNSGAIGFNATPAAANTALATLQYQGLVSGSSPTLDVRVTPGSTTVAYLPSTGRYYERVTATLTHAQAQSAAAGRTFAGRTGYLMNVTSSAENSVIVSQLGGGTATSGWIGGSDAAVDGAWRWVAGPEAGTQFWSGAAAGSAVSGRYANWYSGQPAGSTSQNCAAYSTSSQWDDIDCATTQSTYFVEYGGQSSDAPAAVNVSGTVTMTVAPAAPTVTGLPTGTVAATTATATLSGSGGTFECSLDGAAWAPCTSPVSLTSLSPGSHTFRARETVSGVTGNNSSNTWVVDPVLGAPIATWG
ncbi:MAG: lectin-like protein, partial [Actinomycetota bacterium]